MSQSKITTLSTVKIDHADDLYKIVDSLNRTLKEDNLMFGLTLSEDNYEKAIFTIYRT
ncbi:YpmA family protein [Gracilibacillus caseinilyticus]|uniref:YpmA family protein n=1 Tax=Gracilibacillus caseinilyticus TaxID=2932256 RepID=A0ABY4ET48_9BACI|nr:YpmA family protein [Gracilibacillus caseinilyticus]UOQ47602.1 YpmA family protein [Gracilibacillus caseinilyticus]